MEVGPALRVSWTNQRIPRGIEVVEDDVSRPVEESVQLDYAMWH